MWFGDLTDGRQPFKKGIMKGIGEWYCATWWQQRAEQVSRSTGSDCDQTCDVIINEMKAKGLQPGKDFVAMYGDVYSKKDIAYVRHMALEMFGRYRVDGTSRNAKMIGLWKGQYKNV